jgi:hypothetical protein
MQTDMSERDANKALVDTSRLRALTEPAFIVTTVHDPLEDTQRMDVYDRRRRRDEATTLRERRKPSTVGERNVRNAAEHARDIFADRQQELIEAKLWPQY